VLLRARGLTALRPRDDVLAAVFSDVDLDVAAGTLSDVTGPSGSGKTTLLLALARLLPGVSGQLHLDDVAAADVEPRSWRIRVAYLPQRATLVPGTVADNLSLPWGLKVRAGVAAPTASSLRDALDSVSLGDVALDRDAARLSVGQAARVALLRTILTRPAVLLLDEPDASLDDESAAGVSCMTADFVTEGGAVVRVRHARTDVQADRRYRLADGRLTEVAARE
jgi:putative ABC transport system ATP-binding protein